MDHPDVRGWLRSARRIVVLTGAGISTASGIPDFRGPNGLWTKNPAAEQTSTLRHYLEDPAVRQRAWRNRLDSPTWTAQPNPAHLALVDLEATGRLHAIVTQNVDGLHQAAGSDPSLVIEVHGSMHWARCWSCDDRLPMLDVLVRVSGGEADPPCDACGGILKSDTISFGQALVPETIERALRVAEECDLLLAVGSSLQVAPVANVVPRAVAAGARVVIINGEPTKLDHLAHAVVLAEISAALPELVG